MLKNILKICIVSLIHIFILFSLAPIIDNAFSPLHKDDTNTEILVEIITQLLFISFVWSVLNQYVLKAINRYFNIRHTKVINNITSTISSLVLIGLQSHLINKLQYITHEHPLRIFKIFET